ncbi:type II toxin-antitoxin system HicA family toxin [Corynebacterium suedekumii]|uniref:Type II toxin-antitoxin system HicA family toxin n=1 Tax=Corynebacterium suedekumii TaxID=3049801 RepID=A0ABY8VNW1_9CORY|nr:type II toxin-antitoxin system HicA family toxin [Corynebacterium suedekumii]WIM70358.1 type II toxin-antitoxin system HicA family toxin [Corynebacterium suedekumii]
MIAEQATRKVVRELRKAGFVPVSARGSHTKWQKGKLVVVVPDGHKTISPGVYRQIRKIMEESA